MDKKAKYFQQTLVRSNIYFSLLGADTSHLVKQNKMDIQKWKHLQVKNSIIYILSRNLRIVR